MSGRVLNETGLPVPGAWVTVNYATTEGSSSNPPFYCPFNPQSCWLSTRTTDEGAYQVEFEPVPAPSRTALAGSLGIVYAERGFDLDVQWVPVGPSPTVRDLRLRSTPRILAGASLEVTVEPISSLCTDLEDNFALQYRCEQVMIESGPGTLIVEARAASGGPTPTLFWYTTGNYAGGVTRLGPGLVSISARGGTYIVMVGLPEGTPSQRFTVTTSLR